NGTDNNDYVDGQGFCCDDGSPEAAQTRALALENNFQDPDAYEKLQFYYHPDHLGSSSYITNLDGEVVQHIEYVPFGEVFMEERNNIWNTPYLFNAKEFDEETGLYYYGARYYDSRLSLWISTDPLQEKYVNITSYCYTYNNPVIFIDPDGRHVEVTKSKDGSYVVSGGKANKDQNIYENYGLKNQRVIGKMLTQYSFMNDDGNAIKGSIIDLSDKSGEEFLSDFMNNTPSLIDYMPNAIGGEKYDFKRNGTEYGDNNYNNSLYHHRGMIVSIDNKKYIASARDIGNFAAGYIAGKNDLSWAIARLGFDLLETKQHMSKGEFGFFKEGNPTRYAEKAGFDVGRMTDIAKAIRKAKLYRSMYPPRIW
ncbi:RHS repeat domain-containing protein, partial [Bacteroides finegoldii]